MVFYDIAYDTGDIIWQFTEWFWVEASWKAIVIAFFAFGRLMNEGYHGIKYAYKEIRAELKLFLEQVEMSVDWAKHVVNNYESIMENDPNYWTDMYGEELFWFWLVSIGLVVWPIVLLALGGYFSVVYGYWAVDWIWTELLCFFFNWGYCGGGSDYDYVPVQYIYDYRQRGPEAIILDDYYIPEMS